MIRCKGKMKIGKIEVKTSKAGSEYAVGSVFDKDTNDSIGLIFAAFGDAIPPLMNARVNDMIEFEDAKLVNGNSYKKDASAEDNNLRKLLLYQITAITRQGKPIFEQEPPTPKKKFDKDEITIVEDDLPF